jgi:integrase
MPRPSKGARVYLAPARKGHEAGYVIRDTVNKRRVEIPCTGSGKADFEEAEKQLKDYLAGKHDPEAGRNGDANKIKLADAISVYALKKVPKLARPDAIKKRLDTLNEKLGDLFIGQIDGAVQEEYADNRADEVVEAWAAKGKDKDPDECYAAPRRELEDMAAAINYFARHKRGGVQAVFRPVLPDANPAHTRWLTRSEAAKLVWKAWTMKEDRHGQGRHGMVGHNSEGSAEAGSGRRTGKHIARLILIGLYTGTRKSPMIDAALLPTIGRSYVDLDRGVFQRLALGKQESNKRQPTVPIPPKLLMHMRRWKRLGISNHSVIEWQGNAIKAIAHRSWKAIREAAGFPDVRMHTLRHTAISWYLRAGVPMETVSDYCGVSVNIIRKVYKHHLPGNFDALLTAAGRFGRT